MIQTETHYSEEKKFSAVILRQANTNVMAVHRPLNSGWHTILNDIIGDKAITRIRATAIRSSATGWGGRKDNTMRQRSHQITANLEQTVIENGFCVGCGACAAIPESLFSISLNGKGQYQASADEKIDSSRPVIQDCVGKVCPFSDSAANEDSIAHDLFVNTCDRHTEGLGYFQAIYGGHVTQDGFRERGSSGGFGSWVLNELLETKAVDHIIHVRPSEALGAGHPLFTYQVSSSAREVALGGKSRYYPVELSQVLKHVRETPGRYAIIGLPCFIKSVRLLQRQDPIIKERIRFCIGLVCGHLKSTQYAESLAWQAGIEPQSLNRIDFRVKDNTERADRYCTLAASNKEERIIPTKELKGTDWGAGAFKYKACDFCDDVFAETADMVLGDAWLPQFVGDPLGTNVLVVRDQRLDAILRSAAEARRIQINSLPETEALTSQDAGLRHRREGLGYRLHLEKMTGNWAPKKRVPASPRGIPPRERRRQEMRIKMRELSHSSFQKAKHANDISLYIEPFTKAYREYKKIKPSRFNKLALKTKRFIQNLAGRS